MLCMFVCAVLALSFHELDICSCLSPLFSFRGDSIRAVHGIPRTIGRDDVRFLCVDPRLLWFRLFDSHGYLG